MAFRFITLNKAKCRHCGDTLISDPKHASKEEVCSCGKLKMYGGGTALVRTGAQGVDYDELSQMSFDDCPAVNEDTQDPPPEQNEIIDHLKNPIK